MAHNLTLIAKANKVNVKDLQHWNKLSGNNLKAGQVLVMQDTTQALGQKADPIQGPERRLAVYGCQAFQR